MSRVTSNTKGPQRKLSSGSQVSTKNITPIDLLNQAKELTDKFRISMMKFHGDSEKPFSKRYASINDRVTKSTKAVLCGIAKQPIHRTKIPVNLSIFQYDGNNLVKASGHLDTVKGKLVFIDEKSSTPIIFDGVKSLKDKALPHEPVFVLDTKKKNLSLVINPSPLQLRSDFGTESKLRSFYDTYQTKRLEVKAATATMPEHKKEESVNETKSTSKKTTLETVSNSNYESDIDELTRALMSSEDFNSPVILADQTLDNTTSYDFSYYEYLLPTESAWAPLSIELSTEAIALIDMLEKGGFDSELAYSFFQSIEKIVTLGVGMSFIPVNQRSSLIAGLLGCFYGDSSLMQILFNAFVTMPNQLGLISLNPNMVAMSFEKMLFEALKHGLISEQLSQPSEIWRYVILYLAFTPGAPRNEPLLASYDFEVFAPSSINIGLRHVYRQYWRPLAVQPGEVVRTIPLGPRQTMKVCTKIIQRSKTVTLTETQEEKETTTESATTTKDSSEVVKEASSTFNWNVEASVSGTYGYASGSLKAGMGGDSKDRSQQTSSKLNEAMQKTSTKLRQQSKISISTEQESTFEQTTATEITNPNDEIAVTYEYLKLQQQYELFTFLAEVDSVIYVAEQVPSASEVNDEWVRKYGWILAKVLLDDSYAPILREVVNELSDPDPMDGLDKDPFKELMDNATTRFAQFGAYNNLSDGSIVGTTPTTVGMSDIYSDPAKTYAEWLRSRAALKKANALRDSRWNRLFDHIRDNILHYCRAIWQNEDRDQRTLRYKKLGLTIPALWELDGKSYFPAIAYQNVTVPLHEAIDPTGPLGFFGNYAIYHLRQFDIDKPNESILSIFDMFAQLRHTYVNDDGSLRDPALVWEREHAKVPANLNDDIVRDVVYYLSRLKVSLLDENGAVLRDNAGKLQNPVSKNDWGEYLYRKKHTDRLLLDSNNLYIYLRPGKGSTMEPFKQAHRFIDVLKAKEEYEKLLLQNQQREQSLSVPGILDPDVQKVIIVDSKTGQISIAAAGISAGTPNS